MDRTLLRLGFVLVALSPRDAAALRWCWIYAAYANWIASVIGAVSGASGMTPLAGAGTHGGAAAEATVSVLVISLSLAALAGAGFAIWGLRHADSAP